MSVAEDLRLSPREVTIVRWVFDDLTESQMSTKSGISQHTIHTHLRRVYKKLSVGSRAALVVEVISAHHILKNNGRPPRR